MARSNCRPFIASRRKPLAAFIASFFVWGTPMAYPTTFVTNCNDAGSGSLRSAIGAAADGDTVDLTGLTTASVGCSASTITLQTGDITVAQDHLVIKGPTASRFTLTGKYNGSVEPFRIFTHTGSGIFEIDDLTITKGYATGSADQSGGCISSAGNLILRHVDLTLCSAQSSSGTARGGALYAHGLVALHYSSVTHSKASGTGAFGGGVDSAGNFSAAYSTVSGNEAGSKNSSGIGGGVFATGAANFLYSSTVSNNIAYSNVGGVAFLSSSEAFVWNSTISGNTADGEVGGLYVLTPYLSILNSTIAFNKAAFASPSVPPGVQVVSSASGATLSLSSTLISNNTYGAASTANDFFGSGFTVSGSNNLIFAPNSSVPSDTIAGKCPLLAPLKNNGGLTATHALLSHSPAIDAGNNPESLGFDQRGAPFVRASGLPGTSTPQPDIGAYELNQADEIFDTEFEGCN